MKPLALRALIALGALLVLGALNMAILGKEQIKRSGEVVYLPLAPVDPRSLIQGDYMALRFALTADLERREEAGQRGAREGVVAFANVALDGQRVARLAGNDAAPALKLRYRIRNGQVWLGTNAFFFEEGTAERFNGARYGEFRVDRETGEAVLVGLRDDKLKAL
jgi:uncharacterized membrane-anchored protein